jgi:hypothetical protein
MFAIKLKPKWTKKSRKLAQPLIINSDKDS